MLKISGLFEPPQEMLDILNRKVSEYYAGVVLFLHQRNRRRRAEKGEDLSHSDRIIEECLKYTSIPRDPKGETLVFRLPLLLSNWKYLTPEKKKLLYQWFKEELIEDSIEVRINALSADPSVFGMYNFETNIMEVAIHKYDVAYLNQFKYGLHINQTTAKHELIHALQFILTKLTRLDRKKNIAGLPPKNVRKKDIDLYGRKDKTKSMPDTHHMLRDIEFYTNLTDEVNDYLFFANYERTPKMKEQLAKLWIGSENMYNKLKQHLLDTAKQEPAQVVYSIRPFFMKLKNHDPERYQKAVKVFWNEINKKINF